MGDLKPIIDAISEDGAEKAEKILSAARERATRLYRDFEAEKQKKREGFEKSVSDELEGIYSAQNVKMRQYARTVLLKAKANAIKSAADDAAKRVAELPDEEYLQFLERLYGKTDCKNGGVIYLNERDKKRIKKGIFGKLKIADRCIDILGGFVLSDGDVEYDCTLEVISEERYGEICDSVSTVYERGDMP